MNRLSCSTRAHDERKKNSQKIITEAYISRMCRETPSGGIPVKYEISGYIAEVINFQNFMSIGQEV
jgi:hypothetical protein